MTGPISKLAGVCGWPIHHSLSPTLHSFWLRELGIRGAYVPFMVKPWEALSAFQSLKKTTISGVNVTLPLKRAAFEAADEQTDDAQHIGAANCLYVRRGQLIAHNTDMAGFSDPLRSRRSDHDLKKMTALIFGAGGASRAVIAALLSMGVQEIILVNRTDYKAERLVSDVGLPSFYSVPWDKRHLAVKRAHLLINASSAGMAGYAPLDVTLSQAKKTALVYDLVYTPEITPLIASAHKAGLETLGGLDMLIGQAKPSFQLFYGHPVPDTDPTPRLRAALTSGQR